MIKTLFYALSLILIYLGVAKHQDPFKHPWLWRWTAVSGVALLQWDVYQVPAFLIGAVLILTVFRPAPDGTPSRVDQWMQDAMTRVRPLKRKSGSVTFHEDGRKSKYRR